MIDWKEVAEAAIKQLIWQSDHLEDCSCESGDVYPCWYHLTNTQQNEERVNALARHLEATFSD